MRRAVSTGVCAALAAASGKCVFMGLTSDARYVTVSWSLTPPHRNCRFARYANGRIHGKAACVAWTYVPDASLFTFLTADYHYGLITCIHRNPITARTGPTAGHIVADPVLPPDPPEDNEEEEGEVEEDEEETDIDP